LRRTGPPSAPRIGRFRAVLRDRSAPPATARAPLAARVRRAVADHREAVPRLAATCPAARLSGRRPQRDDAARRRSAATQPLRGVRPNRGASLRPDRGTSPACPPIASQVGGSRRRAPSLFAKDREGAAARWGAKPLIGASGCDPTGGHCRHVPPWRRFVGGSPLAPLAPLALLAPLARRARRPPRLTQVEGQVGRGLVASPRAPPWTWSPRRRRGWCAHVRRRWLPGPSH
jgi:hypothetical protein